MKTIIFLLMAAAVWFVFAHPMDSGPQLHLHTPTAYSPKVPDQADNTPVPVSNAPIHIAPQSPPPAEPVTQPKRGDVGDKPDAPSAEELVGKLDTLLNDIKKD